MTERDGPRVRLRIRDESDVVITRRRVCELAAQQGLSDTATAALALAVSEIVRNVVIHAGGGEIVLAAAVKARRRGVIVTARDAGPGIADIPQAMQDGFSTGRGLGFGLPGARRQVDEFAIESSVGVGTKVTLVKWAAPEAS